MAMKITKYKIVKAALAFCLALMLPVIRAQDDRGERLQQSISSSNERTDFSARKAAPSKIDSFAFQELLKAKKECTEAQQRFAKSRENYHQEKAMRPSTDTTSLKQARSELDAARAALKRAERAVKAAQRKANAD
jgi:hypothetical protein